MFFDDHLEKRENYEEATEFEDGINQTALKVGKFFNKIFSNTGGGQALPGGGGFGMPIKSNH
jgi:hypothetical protein